MLKLVEERRARRREREIEETAVDVYFIEPWIGG
jgi:hypothetical protein